MNRIAVISERWMELGDARLTRRLVHIVTCLANLPGGSIPAACMTHASSKGTYRFFSNDAVDPDAIIDGHARSVITQLTPGSTVLLIQDTTEISLTSHPATQGLGTLDGPGQMGIKMHNVLMATPDGEPLALLREKMWTRPPEEYGKHRQRKQRPAEDKESIRWEETQRHVEAMLPDGVQSVTVADREADIFSLFAQARRPGSELLIRLCHDRRVNGETKRLHETVGAAAVLGEVTVAVPRGPKRKERAAQLLVRAATVEIVPPRATGRSKLVPVRVQIVLAEEHESPKGQRPIRWMLLTTMPVAGIDDAIRMITWYKRRWLIERFHFALKDGCKVEELQLEHVDRLKRAIAVYSLVALHILRLRYFSELHPDASCETVLKPDEWKALHVLITKSKRLPAQVPSIREAVGWLARLGGFLARKGDGEPGVKTIWRGMRKLEPAVMMYRALQS
jgi:hypothetical protein